MSSGEEDEQAKQPAKRLYPATPENKKRLNPEKLTPDSKIFKKQLFVSPQKETGDGGVSGTPSCSNETVTDLVSSDNESNLSNFTQDDDENRELSIDDCGFDMEQSPVKNFDSIDFALEGSPVYMDHLLSLDEIAVLLMGKGEKVEENKVCWKLPPICPDKGEWCFLINLDVIAEADLTYDEHGSWGPCRGHVFYFKINQEGIIERIGRRDKKPKPSVKWEFSVHLGQYTHPEDSSFKKTIYKARSVSGSQASLAVIQYESAENPSHICSRKPHGNSKSKSPFKRVRPSTRDMMLQQSSIAAPKKALAAVRSKLGPNALPTEIPRGSKQAHSIAAKNPNSKRSNAAGRPAANDFSPLQRAMQTPGSFVRAFKVTPAQTEKESQHVMYFLGDPRGLSMLKNCGLKTSDVKRPISVDMTYNVINGLYLTPVQIRHPYFKNRNGREPIIPVGFLLSNYRDSGAYKFLAESLAQEAKLKDSDTIHVWLSDGEAALIDGFSKVEQFKGATHLRCELHLKENIEAYLRTTCSNESRSGILKQIFGTERVEEGEIRLRKAGLVDANSEAEFQWLLNQKEAEWERIASGFFHWFKQTKMRIVADSYLLPKRLQIGTAGRVTNNDSERLNGLIHTELEHKSVPVQKGVEILERFVDAIFERLQWAVIRRDDWRLVGKFASKEIPPSKWVHLTENQKMEHWKSMGLCKQFHPGAGSAKRLSFPLTEAQISFISMQDVMRIEQKAEQILSNGDEAFSKQPGGGGMTSVWDGNNIFTLKGIPSTGLKCSCPDFQHYQHICCHSVAFAEKEKLLFPFITWLNSKASLKHAFSDLKTSKNAIAGKKPGARRRGSMASAGTHQATTALVVMQPPNFVPGGIPGLVPSIAYLQSIQIAKPRAETETISHPHWNSWSFWIGRGKPPKDSCKGCGKAFLSENDPGNFPPADLFLRHKEKWVYKKPPTMIPTMSCRTTDYYYCCKLSCILPRFPYFWVRYLKIDVYSLDLIANDPAYEAELQAQFGIPLSSIKTDEDGQ